MKQIDYQTAIELMAFQGRTDVTIMVREIEPVDYNTLYHLQLNEQVMFFIPDDPEEGKHPAEEKSTPPLKAAGSKAAPDRRREDTGAV